MVTRTTPYGFESSGLWSWFSILSGSDEVEFLCSVYLQADLQLRSLLNPLYFRTHVRSILKFLRICNSCLQFRATPSSVLKQTLIYTNKQGIETNNGGVLWASYVIGESFKDIHFSRCFGITLKDSRICQVNFTWTSVVGNEDFSARTWCYSTDSSLLQ